MVAVLGYPVNKKRPTLIKDQPLTNYFSTINNRGFAQHLHLHFFRY